MSKTRTHTRRLPAPPVAGFSLIEVLIGAALLLVVALGLLPLFSNSILNNTQGDLSSQVANHARGEAERLFQLPFNSAELTPAGGANELETVTYYSTSTKEWIDEALWDGSEPEYYKRTSRIRQFAVQAIDPKTADYEFEDGEVQPGGAPPDLVDIKEIQVTVEGSRPLGGRKSAIIRVYKPF